METRDVQFLKVPVFSPNQSLREEPGRVEILRKDIAQIVTGTLVRLED